MTKSNPPLPRIKAVVFLAILVSVAAIVLAIRPTGATPSVASVAPISSPSSDQPISTEAISLVVNDTGDASDTNVGDSICDSSATAGTQCTLRAAIQETNAVAGDDSITFDASLNGGTITLNTALPDINGNLILTGPGAGLLRVQRSSVGGTPNFRIFRISTSQTVTISGLSLSNGNATGAAPSSIGGGVLNEGTLIINSCVVSGSSGSSGGGIANRATLTINNSTIDGNTSSSSGGGVSNGGESQSNVLTIHNSTISNNTSQSFGGGGIYNIGHATINNSTISTNTGAQGGGIHNVNPMTLTNVTIASNTGATQGGGIYNPGIGIINLANTIIAGNTSPSGPDCHGFNLNSQDYNLIGDTTDGNFTGTTTHNITNVNALLGPLASNGGPTLTHALLFDSPAIDAGNTALPTDQRGQPRPVNDITKANAAGGNASDIGAYEAHTFQVNSTADSNDSVCASVGTGNGCTLREAIERANAEFGVELITFAPALTSGGPATITLSSALPDPSSEVTISGPGANLLTVERSTAGGTPAFRILTINPASIVTISGLRISNGNAAGGSYPSNSGGGIFNSGTLTLNDCIVSSCTAIGGGGGISNVGSLTINRSTVSGNSGSSGGGIYNRVSVSGTATVTLNDSTVSGNNATSSGAGIYNVSTSGTSAATFTIRNSTISGNVNSGTLGGGGIYNAAVFGSVTTLTITNSTVSGNTNNGAGGGLFHFTNGAGSTATATITNSTIASNSAGSSSGGGGIETSAFNSTTLLRLRNTIVAGNLRNSGTISSDVAGEIDSLSSFNLIGDGSGMTGLSNGSNGNQVGTTLTPVNARLAPLASNGGTTLTHALLPGSSAIDSGDNCILNNSCAPPLTSAITTDQRGAGFNRSVDGDGNGLATVDIGAYEVQSILVTNTNDSGAGSLRQAITDAGAAGGTHSINFPAGLTGIINLLTELPGLSSDITITGPGANLLRVQRSAEVGTPNFAIFTINPNRNVNISGLNISNGNYSGIFNLGSVVLNNCIIDGNRHGVVNRFELTINDSVISNSTETGFVNETSSGPTVTATINNCTIFGNLMSGIYNGGTFATRVARLTVNNSTISANNLGGIGGGGISSGGVQDGTAITLINNSTISGNKAGSGPGFAGGVSALGWDNGSAAVTINNSTITANDAPVNGTAGLSIDTTSGGTATIKLHNTIVAGNYRAGGIPSDIASTVDPASSFNLIGTGGSGGLSHSVNNNLVGVANALLGPLANNGGPTQTHALLRGSPALDAANNAFIVNPTFSGPPFIDQRGAGFARIVDGPDADTTATVDIGAFEAQVSVPDIADQTINEDGSLSLPFNVGGASITSVTATSSNTTLVPNSPANISISGSGSMRTLIVNPVANLSGTSTITVTVNGDNGQTMTDTFLLTVNSVNDAPSFTKGPDQTVNENDPAQTVNNWATGIFVGPANESGQTAAFSVTNNSNPTLFAVGPAISSTGTLTYTPATGASGTALITIALMDNGGITNGGSDTSATQTFNITVQDGGVLQFNSATYAIAEDGTNAVINVSRTGGTAGVAIVNYASSNGTATAGQDYSAASGTLTFADGVTSQTFNVPITNDLLDEAEETINLTLSSAGGSGSLGTPASAVLTINDNDPAPSISINDVSVAEGDSGIVNATFTVSLTGQSSQTVTVDFLTENGTANGTGTDGNDFQTVSGTITFLSLETTKLVTVAINGDRAFEPNETFFVNLSAPTNATISDNQGLGTINNDDAAGGTFAFSSPTYNTNENAGSTTITVNRLGDTTQPVTVDYATSDVTADGRKDYTPARGTLQFASGIAVMTFPVLVNIDAFTEPGELIQLTLSNPTGGAALGVATSTLQLDNTPWNSPPANSIDQAESFVRQHYHDFLNREPDAAGLAFWANQITECQQPGATCNADVRRINVSAAFFVSTEFQETGYLVYRFYKAAYGNIAGTPVPLTLNEFLPDTQQIGQGVVVGVGDWQTVLENNKVAYALGFVSRPRFTTEYPTTQTPAQFVDAMFAKAGVTPSTGDRDAAANEFGGAANTTNTAARARALRRVAENATFTQQETNRAFVLMQYFGYLRRNPNDPPELGLDFGGYNFWLGKLNQFNGNYIAAEMVKAFITSGEYRQRFGQ